MLCMCTAVEGCRERLTFHACTGRYYAATSFTPFWLNVDGQNDDELQNREKISFKYTADERYWGRLIVLLP